MVESEKAEAVISAALREAKRLGVSVEVFTMRLTDKQTEGFHLTFQGECDGNGSVREARQPKPEARSTA